MPLGEPMMGPTTKTLDRHTFYSALLLALREEHSEFVAEGKQFHRAFLAVVDKVRQEKPFQLKGEQKIGLDPVFGVVNEANEMVLEAEHDRVLSLLNPRLRKAQFKISKAQAKKELGELGVDIDCFRALALYFAEQLTAGNEQRSAALL